ncbi:uncharacterized protein K460DRAFT_275642 [Cucurbitaria berberidis CBS 394.84]|uniref:Uncharacterized protein n=1 Tax=Cucurbitaria berberidis CBS 394.84 TaxID=1168544 RepID=A0A9P4LBB5_9PLEO|nr:uncharacterized protein K460DRAFT_275642 [Cucurbitaria berberidis CBS 394.84]KAF1849396.1 hypothetical protein K460DRAFT_275642 [Cucurbitaria berberidis CBS 394.84]
MIRYSIPIRRIRLESKLPSTPHRHKAQQSLLGSTIVEVQICNQIKQHRKHVVDISLNLLERYAPEVVHLIEANPHNDKVTLPLCLNSLEHSNEIEVPALTSLFAHWSADTTPNIPSIGETVLHYCVLRLLNNREALYVRDDIMSRLEAEPLNEIDVQSIWWGLQETYEFHEWVDAMLYNLAHFDVLNKQPVGGYIELFIETELLGLSDQAHARVASTYRRYRDAIKPTKAPSLLRRATRHVFRTHA